MREDGASVEAARVHAGGVDCAGVIVVDAGRSRSTCCGCDAYIHDHA